MFADVLRGNGTELIKYPEPLHATLIDGSSGPTVTHYCVTDVVLTTKAGNVVLPRTHIDVLQGPEKGRLLYIGKAEETRLHLRSFASQLEDVARRSNETNASVHVTSGQTPPKLNVQEKKSVDGKKTVSFASKPGFTRRLAVQQTAVPNATPARQSNS